jgi:hypothetical protein
MAKPAKMCGKTSVHLGTHGTHLLEASLKSLADHSHPLIERFVAPPSVAP